MRKLKWFVAILVVASITFGTGCKQDTEEEEGDTVAPANVTSLTVTASNGNAVLSWKNPADPDFAGVQISMSPAEGTLKNAVSLGKKVTSLDVSGLTVGKEYTFTVKTFDESLNYSKGAEAKATVAATRDAKITSVSIPVAGTNYAGEVLPVTIIGKDFTAPGVTASGFTSTGATLNNVTIISDTKATAEVACPYAVGTTNVTVSYGESSATGTVKVVAAEKCYSVGDILFTDGTRIKTEKVQYGIPDSQISKAFAVIASAPYGGAEGKAVGLQRSSSALVWAPEDTTGFSTNFTGIQADYSGDSSSGYTFTGDIDGSDNWESICKVDPEGTKDAAINYPAFNFALTYGTTAGITETEYKNGWYVPSVAELYDVYINKNTVQNSLTAVGGFELGTSFYWSSSQGALSYINSCQVRFYDGLVTNFLKFGGDAVFVLQAFNAEQFNNYEVTTIPSITSVTVANAGEGYTGELPVTIIGENLKGHAITSNDASFGNVTYLSDKKATATITCSGVVGESTITVTSGISSATGTVKVVAEEKCYSVGDILFTDGTRIKAENLQYGVPNSQLSKAFAVIASAPYGGVVGKAVGLQRSSGTLKWAPYNTTGNITNFTEIQADYSGDSSSGYIFTGDIDGSDNWEYICSIDPEGTQDAATNYPAFNFALTYGTTAGLTGTEYENGWYVPSVAELYGVYTNKEVVQTSLNAAGGFTLGTSSYWSSSLSASNYNKAYRVFFDDGVVGYIDKNHNWSVFVLQAFNAEQFNNYEIDITPPGDVSNVVAKYSASDNTISVSWTNPTDEDFAGIVITYGKKDSEETTTIELSNDITSYEIENIPYDDSEYTISLKTKDDVENFGEAEIVTLVASKRATIFGVTIPNAGEGYTGELPVTIIGENLIGNVITCNDETFTNITYLSDKKATATITCSGVVGESTITVTSGTSKASGTVKVVAAEKCFTVGDILFTDGTKIKAENLQYGIPDSQVSKAFAVIASAPYGGCVGKAVGLQRSSSALGWTKGALGYNTNFTGIQATLSGDSSSGYTFSGDIDGSDNWEYICSIDPEGTKDAATNYPVFNFALTYGTQEGLTGTEYENGWYVPSVAELYDVYTNKEVVQTSLNAVGGFTLGTSLYWSSSQDASNKYYAYRVYFDYGYVDCGNKVLSNIISVFVLQAFNAEQFN